MAGSNPQFSNPLLFSPRRKVPEIVRTKTPVFRYGVINAVGPRDIARGAATDSLNWLTKGDKIELRRGMAFLGTNSVNNGNGLASGLVKAVDALGVEHLFGTYGQSLKYFDIPTQEWIETGTNLLGPKVVNASGIASEIISLAPYTSTAGNQLFVNSPNCAGYFKIFVSNPGTALNMIGVNGSTNYNGNIKIDNNRTLLWNRTVDKTGLYGSYIDSQTYTTVPSELTSYTGDGTTKNFSGYNLVNGTGLKTVFAVAVTAGSLIFTDNYAGALTAPDGSTGTINYITGALTLTFMTAPIPTQQITVTYEYEVSATKGVADFTFTSPTRVAGQGFIYPQSDAAGGALQGPFGYNGTYYCMHILKTWALTIAVPDSNSTCIPYRSLVGIPNQRAAVEAGEGIYYIDDRDPTNIKVRLLTYATTGVPQVIPVPVSNNLILNNYLFDACASVLWGDLVLFSCRTNDSAVNNRVLCYNKLWKAWDILDCNVACFEVYNGTLVCGDALTNNFMTLFSGWDDLASVIDNYWIGNMDNADIDGLKKTKKLYLEGDIAPGQSYDVYLSYDAGAFVKIGSVLSTGNYVDKSQSVSIGGTTLGEKLIGGNINEPVAYHYELLLPINTDKFEFAQIEFIATGLGYVSIRNYRQWDVRYKGAAVPTKYNQNIKYAKNY